MGRELHDKGRETGILTNRSSGLNCTSMTLSVLWNAAEVDVYEWKVEQLKSEIDCCNGNVKELPGENVTEHARLSKGASGH